MMKSTILRLGDRLLPYHLHSKMSPNKLDALTEAISHCRNKRVGGWFIVYNDDVINYAHVLEGKSALATEPGRTTFYGDSASPEMMFHSLWNIYNMCRSFKESFSIITVTDSHVIRYDITPEREPIVRI